jgi:DNA helicase-2/ATP-dependent DNA helicase PcrA
MNIPEKATKEQTEAITQTEGNIRVASVPGSGKTFVLTYRIAYLSHHLLWRLHLRTRQLRR